MSGLTNLQKRLNYRGGARQIDRMIEDKQRSLNKALLYSYQSATAVLRDGREFRCLINPNKISMELDDKVLSIPFRDICLNKEKPEEITTSDGKEDIGVKCGDIIQWKENSTYWIVYSQYLQETAYFRGQMRQCEPEAITIGDQQFWYYLKGPDEKGIDWQKTKHFIFNELNYSIEIYISKTTETEQFFHRFKKCKIHGKPFEVQAVDNLSIDGILIVYLKEDYSNQWTEEEPEEVLPPEEENEGAQTFALLRRQASPTRIEGPNTVYPYDKISYTIYNAIGGKWYLSNKCAKILDCNDSSVKIEITTGKSGNVDLIYRVENSEDVIYHIEILSL